MSVSRWERGDQQPTHEMLIRLAEISQTPGLKQWFLDAARERSGLSPVDVQAMFLTHSSDDHLASVEEVLRGMRKIPLMRDAAAAGPELCIEDGAVEDHLWLPVGWFDYGGALYALRIVGDSMSPILEEGYIVIVDTDSRDRRHLLGSMVAARSSNGVTIKYLQQSGEQFLLVPQNMAAHNPIRIVQEEGEWSLVGRVVRWIGAPPQQGRAPNEIKTAKLAGRRRFRADDDF
jgi:SOS-response transcriptional repressor LexA